jgi:hypothetical protein
MPIQTLVSSTKLMVASATLALLSPAAVGAILAVDSFDLEGGIHINGLESGLGWGAAWAAAADVTPENPRIGYNNLIYPGYASAGGGAQFRGDYRKMSRLLDVSGSGPFAAHLNKAGDIGRDGTELWISVATSRLDHVAAEGISALTLRRNDADVVQLSMDFDDAAVHLFVLRIQFKEGDDIVTAYFDPALDKAPIGGLDLGLMDASFYQISLGGMYYDEQKPTVAFDGLMIGETAQDIGFKANP